jgi:hypothetical protein
LDSSEIAGSSSAIDVGMMVSLYKLIQTEVGDA